MSDYGAARDRYRPSGEVKVLFVAESPPASGGYFYFDTATGKSSLFSETLKAIGLFPENMKIGKGFNKVLFLKKFQSMGFFVVDVSYKPVNDLPEKERANTLAREIPRLIRDIQELDPKKIIIVKVTIFQVVKDALQKAGLGERILHERGLPFPSCGNQKKYREMLRSILRSI